MVVSSQAAPQPGPPSVRVRSPNYPVISLEEAIQRLQEVYKKEHMHPATREVVAKGLGYAGLNGTSLGIISALIKYGLMVQKGEQIRISENGQDILLHRAGDAEYSRAIREAAFGPALFRELRDYYGESLPSNYNLRVYLQKKGFNPRTVDNVIRVYRDTLDFVAAQTGDDVLVPDEEDGGVRLSPEAQGSVSAASPEPAVASVSAPTGPRENVIAFPFPEGGSVQIVFTGEVTQEVIDYVSEVLGVMKKAYPTRGQRVQQNRAEQADQE